MLIMFYFFISSLFFHTTVLTDFCCLMALSLETNMQLQGFKIGPVYNVKCIEWKTEWKTQTLFQIGVLQ